MTDTPVPPSPAEELNLSPAEQADAENLLAGLAEPVDQYAGLTPLEAAAAATSAHMSTCLRPSRLECVDCAEELHQIRKYIPAMFTVIREEALHRAYWKLRDHAEGYRSAELSRKAQELFLADPDNAVLSRAASRDKWYARGIDAAARDIAELLGVEECDLERLAPRHAVPDDGSYPDGAPVAADLGEAVDGD